MKLRAKSRAVTLSKPPHSHSETTWRSEARHLLDKLYGQLRLDTWVELSVLFQPAFITFIGSSLHFHIIFNVF